MKQFVNCEVICKEAVKNKAMVINNQQPVFSYNAYVEMVNSKGEEFANRFLIKKIAEEQIKIVNNSKKVKEDKKLRVINFWSEYL